MMARILLIAALVLTSSACDRFRECKQGTLFVDIERSGAATEADQLRVAVSVDGALPLRATATTPTGNGGTLEIDFTSGSYPAGKTVVVTIEAVRNGLVVGTGASTPQLLGGGCSRLTVAVSGALPDLAGLDLTQQDLAAAPDDLSGLVEDLTIQLPQDLTIPDDLEPQADLLTQDLKPQNDLKVGPATTLRFDTPSPTAVAGSKLVIADFDKDGHLDVAVSGSPVSVLFGAGNGTLSGLITYATDANPVHIGVGDFNNDTYPDIAVGHNSGNSVASVYLNTETTVHRSFAAESKIVFTTNCNNIAIGRMNADANDDLWCGYGSSSFRAGNGNGTFAAATASQSTSGDYDFVWGDVTGDGKLDLIQADYFDGGIELCTGVGDGTFTPKVTYPTSGFSAYPLGVGFADVDNDGDIDLISAHNKNSTLNPPRIDVVRASSLGVFSSTVDHYDLATSMNNVRQLAVGDLLKRGKTDIVTLSDAGITVLLHSGSGFAYNAPGTILTSVLNVYDVQIADMNEDGRLDLVVVGGGNVNVLINTSF